MCLNIYLRWRSEEDLPEYICARQLFVAISEPVFFFFALYSYDFEVVRIVWGLMTCMMDIYAKYTRK